MDPRILVQQFREIVSLASIAYTLTTLQVISAAINNPDSLRLVEPIDDHYHNSDMETESVTGMSTASTASATSNTTPPSAGTTEQRTNRYWTHDEILLLLDHVEKCCTLTTARGTNLKASEFRQASTTIKTRTASQCHYKWGQVRRFLFNRTAADGLSIAACQYLQGMFHLG